MFSSLAIVWALSTHGRGSAAGWRPTHHARFQGNEHDIWSVMAKFAVPSAAQKPLGQYDVKNGSLWRVRVNEGQHGRVFVSEGTDLKISSNNAQVVPNDEVVFNITDAHGRSGVLNFFGLSPGISMLEARDSMGNVVAYIQLDVASIGGKHAYFELEQPSMALNAADTPVRYQMRYSVEVTADMT